MILLLGADGYVGQAFARALRSRKDSFIPLSRTALDYTRFEYLFDYVRKIHPELVINAEDSYGDLEGRQRASPDFDAVRIGVKGNGGTGQGEVETRSARQGEAGGESGAGVSAVEPDRMEMLQVNVLLPQTFARVCSMTNTPWAHLSSGSIYCGAAVSEEGQLRLEPDLGRPAMRRLYASEPEQFRGFTELDEPNYSFKFGPCTFYSGTKALAEEAIREYRGGYIWRLRLPFNQHDEPGNFLTRLSNLSQIHDTIQCLSQVDDCVNACLEAWERRAPFGIYNVVNPGAITTGELLQMMQQILKPPRRLNLLLYESQGHVAAGDGLRSGCLLDPTKLLANGIRLRDVREAIEHSLRSWEPQAAPAVRIFA